MTTERGPPGRTFQAIARFTDEEEKTTEYHDLWASVPEWENDHDPGQVLDWWREAQGLFAPLSKLAENTDNEALQTAVW